jgi:hypothetical protein
MHGLGLLWRGGAAGADRPDRLVGDDALGQRPGTQPGDAGVELRTDDRFGPAAFAATVASASPCRARRSECPTIASVAPNSATIPADTSPV